jgi:catecholate siderophore receptor
VIAVPGTQEIHVSFRTWFAFLALLWTLPSLASSDAAEPAAVVRAGRVAYAGRVVDADGDPLRGTRVYAYAQGTDSGPVAAATSDADGRFTIQVPAGPYVLRFAMKDFRDLNESVTIDADTPARDFAMQVGVSDSVTVVARNGYVVPVITSGTKTSTPLRDVPQAVTVVTRELMQDQLMTSIGDVVRYVPGVALHQGENNRDQIIMRGNSSSADFFVDGVRDDVQYYRDLYNLDRVEALKGPNAMIFGRGGAGGVINRVTKEAGFAPLREVDLQGGTYGNKRVTADVNQALGEKFALRLNGIYEDSGNFRRHGLGLTRSGIAPSLTYLMNDDTKVTVNYEHFRDTRTADRGITSYLGRPADVPIDTFYGNPDDSHVRASVDLASAAIDHSVGALTIRNRTLYGDYDRSYQNYVPGAVSADKSRVTITAYNNATQRKNVFNQTDLTYALETGAVKHLLLAGVEVGRQLTDNFRNTGFFNDTATSISVPYGSPTIATPVTFRQSATDADNHLRTNVSALYAQDQIELTPMIRLIGGLRFDRFDLTYHNNRNGDTISRLDDLVSPRAGIIVKPADPISIYGSYSVTYLPSSGDQFSSLTTITEQVEPEKFNNYEVGAKWEPSNVLSLTTAVYRLDRTNTRSTDPNDPTRIVQTGSQRTDGYELGINGRVNPVWTIAGGYSYQDAYVTSATTAARAGAVVAQVPHHTLSLWNNVQIHPRVGAALGVIYRSKMFATIDNTVTLPGYTRFDAAAYYNLTHDLRLQLNVENLFDKTYWANADSNTNLSPGSPRAVRLGFVARF